MKRRDLMKAMAAIIGARLAPIGLVSKVGPRLSNQEEVKALMDNRSVMTAEQWLRFHKKHWPPRYD